MVDFNRRNLIAFPSTRSASGDSARLPVPMNITPDAPHPRAASESRVRDGAFRPKAPTRPKAGDGGTLGGDSSRRGSVQLSASWSKSLNRTPNFVYTNNSLESNRELCIKRTIGANNGQAILIFFNSLLLRLIPVDSPAHRPSRRQGIRLELPLPDGRNRNPDSERRA